MTWRVLNGKRLNGTFGFDVSKPGFDVTTANVMQLAFSSDYIAPVKVIGGTFVSAPTSGAAPVGVGSMNGAHWTQTIIGYGRTISPMPVCYAIGSAPGWNVPLAAAPTAQLGYLAGQYHTYVNETMPGTGTANDNNYGPTIGKKVAPTTNFVDETWASARFMCLTFTDRVEFYTNCNNNVTIKYLVLES